MDWSLTRIEDAEFVGEETPVGGVNDGEDGDLPLDGEVESAFFEGQHLVRHVARAFREDPKLHLQSIKKNNEGTEKDSKHDLVTSFLSTNK